MKQSQTYIRVAGLLLFLWLLYETSRAQEFGVVGLGTLLIVAALWSVFRSKRIWKDYRARYRVRKKNQKSIWTEPKEIYFYLHLFVVVPLMIATGLILLWTAAFLRSQT